MHLKLGVARTLHKLQFFFLRGMISTKCDGSAGSHSVNTSGCVLDSSLRVRRHARCRSGMSSFDMCTLGSALSIRSFRRLGFTLSVRMHGNIHDTRKPTSTLSFKFRNTMSLRWCGIMGTALPLLSLTSFASSISLRSYKIVGSTMSILKFSNCS